ncbi:vascular cell adhesion protein 1-like [Pyxicephalus adspersus]|uniref:vascular cell adhesion protein 1-like n=1 Tax=Pyxicephalus adspersus TaxID=30357 RepID=UPI003B5C7CAE
MELPRDLFCVLFYICGIIHTGWSKEQCNVQIVSTQEFVPFGEWALLNCTYNCSRPSWESSLKMMNEQEGDHWVSTEVLVNNWEESSISCISDAGEEELKSTVTVTAYALPSKVEIDLEEELEEGAQHEVACTVFEVAPLANLQISVMRGGKVVDTLTFEGDPSKGKNSVSETFHFTVSRRDNLQEFYCQANLQLGTTEENMVESKKIMVKTFAKPEYPDISITPDTSIKEGESVTLTCHSDGLPEPEYSWELPSGAHVTFSQDSSQVIITKAISEHRGIYLCMAKNKHGRVRSERVLDIIKNPGAQPDTPYIMYSPGTIVTEGESLNLTCFSGGVPKPEYSWAIPSKDHVSFSADKTGIFIIKASSAHNGTYKCEAQNVHGTATNHVVISVIGQPNGVIHTKPRAILLISTLAIILALI